MELSEFVGLAKSDRVQIGEDELFAAFDGDAVALDRLWRSCRGVVIQMAKRFGMLDFDVVLGECEAVFMVCVEKYPVRNGFHAYFRKACCHRLCDAIAWQMPVHVPKTVLDCVRSTSKLWGVVDNVDEWKEQAVALGWSLSQAECALEVMKARYGVSMNVLPDEVGAMALADVPRSEECVRNDVARRDYLEFLLARLPERLALVVRHYYGVGCAEMTQAELGAMLGVSPQSVSLVLKQALGKLSVFASEENNSSFCLSKAG